MPHVTVRKVELVTRPGEYRQESDARTLRLLDAGKIRLIGADGDEEANTVTYWYDVIRPDDDAPCNCSNPHCQV